MHFSFKLGVTITLLPYLARNLKFDKNTICRIATNAVNERTFSALCRLKTWLRTTAQHVRLNWCTILFTRTELAICLFVACNDSRIHIP